MASIADVPGSTGSFFARIGAGLSSFATAVMRARGRTDQLEALQAKTDEELAAFGIKRDEIVQYVFRDVMY